MMPIANLDLFYYTARSAIQESRADYLKKQKAIAFQQELPKVEEASAEAYANMNLIQKIVYEIRLKRLKKKYKKALRKQKRPMDEKLTKGFNAGVEEALNILECIYKQTKTAEKASKPSGGL